MFLCVNVECDRLLTHVGNNANTSTGVGDVDQSALGAMIIGEALEESAKVHMQISRTFVSGSTKKSDIVSA